jgi:hypothetical protein
MNKADGRSPYRVLFFRRLSQSTFPMRKGIQQGTRKHYVGSLMSGGNMFFFFHPRSVRDSRPVAEMVVKQRKIVEINKYVLIVDQKKRIAENSMGNAEALDSNPPKTC